MFGYQWLLNGKPIPGATFASYVVPAADSGQQISVTVYAAGAGLETATATAPAVTITPSALPRTTVARRLTAVKKPSISGKRRVGATLKVGTGKWSSKPKKLSYQWLRDGKPIHGATKASFKVVSADAGAKLSVKVAASAAGDPTATVTTAAVKVAK